jgi:hypothetical protein
VAHLLLGVCRDVGDLVDGLVRGACKAVGTYVRGAGQAIRLCVRRFG